MRSTRPSRFRSRRSGTGGEVSRMTWRPPATTPTITGLVAIALALVLGAFAAGAQAAPPEQFQMIDLGTLGGPGPAAALAVNNNSQVVGSSSPSDPPPA